MYISLSEIITRLCDSFCCSNIIIIIIISAQTPEIKQGLGCFLSCGARKPEQT